jgi:hypothetical protein
MDSDVYRVKEPYSGRGMLVLHDPNRKTPLKKLGCSALLRNEAMLDSIRHHLARVRLYGNIESFLREWKYFVEKSREISKDERDLEQKRDDLNRIGIKCYFYRRKGVDSAASKVTILREIGNPIEFNIDIESKLDAGEFFRPGDAGNRKKYPRLPVLILCHEDNSNQHPEQYYPHPVLCINDLLQILIDSPMEMYPIITVAETEIERLHAVIQEERQIVAREKADARFLKNQKAKKTS